MNGMTRKRTNYIAQNGWIFSGDAKLPRHVTLGFQGTKLEIRVGPKGKIKRCFLDLKQFDSKEQAIGAAEQEIERLKCELEDEGYRMIPSPKNSELRYQC